jgi:predicted RNA binding protein YcfA (HicA-like mRNA interferase family)
VQVRQESSHRTFKKDDISNNVVVNGHDGDDVSPGVLSKIRRETRLPLR